MVEPLVRFEQVSFQYEGSEELALRGVDLELHAGEFVLLTGPSGCGKTTLARCINGLAPHLFAGRLTGRVLVGGQDTAAHKVAHLATLAGMVFQIPETQLFNLTPGDEVAFGCRNLGLPEAEVESRVAWALDAVGLAGHRDRTLFKLSGGEKQLTAIASVIAMRPRVLVLDEPLSSLDGRGVARVLEVLAHLNRDLGITVVVMEHRTPCLAGVADRMIVMDRGRIVLDGPLDLMRQRSDRLARLGVRPLHRVRCEEPAPASNPGAARHGEPAVSVENVRFAYNGHPVLRDVSLQVRHGEIVALVGDNGAGKSTLARLIAGALKPGAGKVRVSVEGATGQRVGLLLQNPTEQLFCDTVEEEVAFGPENLGMDSDLDRSLALADLAAQRTRSVERLSGGEQQRLALAAILALKPQVLVLDEPTLGQDWGHLTRFMELVRELRSQGAAVLLITHDAELAAMYADRQVRLADGCILT